VKDACEGEQRERERERGVDSIVKVKNFDLVFHVSDADSIAVY
jgi:hypothetical protein